MIRQTHTYFAGALSGAALIAAAVVAFVLLVSLQALRDWPLAGLGGGDSTRVSAGRPAAAGRAGSAHAGGPAAARQAGRGGGQNGAAATAGQHGNVAAGTSPPLSVQTPAGGTPGSSPTAGKGSPGTSPTTASSSGGGSPGRSGPPLGGGSGLSPSGAVNGAVSGIDQATGGALGETGVTKVTEEAVKGVAGPESPVGKTVDKAGETVGGLLPSSR